MSHDRRCRGANLQEIPVRIPDSVPPDSPPQTIVVGALGGCRILAEAKGFRSVPLHDRAQSATAFRIDRDYVRRAR
jgi:hypothetical protein